jgi:hypothetical protein
MEARDSRLTEGLLTVTSLNDFNGPSQTQELRHQQATHHGKAEFCRSSDPVPVPIMSGMHGLMAALAAAQM